MTSTPGSVRRDAKGSHMPKSVAEVCDRAQQLRSLHTDRTRDPAERFWEKVDKQGECWEWMAFRFTNGYGRFYSGKEHGDVAAHRWSYEQEYGPIPDGLVMDHLCRNRGCVRPDHLEAVTHRTNLLRGVGVSAVHAAKTHCHRGHPFDEENTYRHSRGRACRACRRIADRKRCR